MKLSTTLLMLTAVVLLLALTVSAAGLFSQDGGQPFSFTTLHGDTVKMSGQGLYRNDTYFKAPLLRGTDAVTLFLVVPLGAVSLFLARHGSLRGRLLLNGVLAYFLYHAASDAFGITYNTLMLGYVAYFSASLFAFILAMTSFDLPALSARISPAVPRRGMAIFMIVAGLTVFVWLPELISTLLRGTVPALLASYHTEVTYIIDPGIIAPTAFLAGVLLLRRAPLGYLLAAVMLILNALVGAVVIGQTVTQFLAGIVLSQGELIGFVGSFAVMGSIAVALLARYFRAIGAPAPAEVAAPQTTAA